jgi:hypothetical protein
MPGPIASLVRPGRDLRVDFLRGLALWFIFIDHTPGNLLGQGTLRNVAFCDATEGFVLLAGYASGIAYGRLLEREGWLAAAAKVAGRAGTLYVAHIFLFVVFTAQVGYSAALLDQAAIWTSWRSTPSGRSPTAPCWRRCCCATSRRSWTSCRSTSWCWRCSRWRCRW